jgi:hypothetical protein
VSESRIQWVRNGSIWLAYRIFGDGDTTLLWSTGWATNLDFYDEPTSSYAIAMQMLSAEMRARCRRASTPLTTSSIY